MMHTAPLVYVWATEHTNAVCYRNRKHAQLLDVFRIVQITIWWHDCNVTFVSSKFCLLRILNLSFNMTTNSGKSKRIEIPCLKY